VQKKAQIVAQSYAPEASGAIVAPGYGVHRDPLNLRRKKYFRTAL
jgi:hypothetical protein